MPQPKLHQTPKEELVELATKLKAIGDWHQDCILGKTTTGEMLVRAAEWLKAASWNTCGQGFVGCRGGDACDSDHK